jgi:plastocyanin
MKLTTTTTLTTIWRIGSLLRLPLLFSLPLLVVVSCNVTEANKQAPTSKTAAHTSSSPRTEIPPARSSINSSQSTSSQFSSSQPSSPQSSSSAIVNTAQAEPVDKTPPIAAIHQPITSAPSASDSDQLKKNTSKANPEVSDLRKPISETATEKLGSVSGSIRIIGTKGETLSPQDVIINLEPNEKTHAAEKNDAQPAQPHKIQISGKTYRPGLIAIRKNDLVSFENKDAIKHNVFSSSSENTFDLGTYGLGEIHSTKLLASGIVKVYCNIHPEMASFISVSEHNYSFITKTDGKFMIKNLPPQQYTLTAWNIRGELKKVLMVPADTETHVDLTIDVSDFKPEPHKNKFGEAYKIKPKLFNDELY